jgi:hypothetical protein
MRLPRRFWRGNRVSEFDDLVADFLVREKKLLTRHRWRGQSRADYATIRAVVAVPGVSYAGRLVVTAHRLRMPAKYCFSLLLRGERVFALDVNPSRFHQNLLVRASVNVTHWQVWPKMEADIDNREMAFASWFYEFMQRANVSYRFRALAPPRGVQMELPK